MRGGAVNSSLEPVGGRDCLQRSDIWCSVE